MITGSLAKIYSTLYYMRKLGYSDFAILENGKTRRQANYIMFDFSISRDN